MCPRFALQRQPFAIRLCPGLAFAFCYFVTSALLPAQQFRAAWADVFNSGLTSQAGVNNMVNSLVSGHYNAVIVQVLAYMDNSVASHGAMWKSSIVPWSSRTTASFDPLGYLVQQAHANGIEVHAWLGGSGAAMYRISTSWPPAGNATLTAHPEWTMVPQADSEANAVALLDGNYALDMGSPDAQEYVVSIVRELVTNYQIDGINWDDEVNSAGYTAGMGFPAYSQASYSRSGLARYRINTGFMGTPSATETTYGNYRRRFKNELMARCQAEIQSIKTNPRQPLRHTSAVMAYGGPPSTCTFTSEEAYLYYSDWPTMLQNGWLDAAIPMNYKANSNNASLYNTYCDRAYSCWRYNRHIYVGLGAYLNPRSNTVTQLQYAYYTNGFNGAVTYSYGVPYATAYDTAGDWWSYAAANIYTSAATIPPMPWRNPATATEGIMWGRVRDASTGNYLDDATVTVSGRPAVKTDGNGYYVVTLIPATASGTSYPVTASKSSFISQNISAAKVIAGDVARYDFFLNLPAPSGLSATAVSSNQISLSWASNATNAIANVISRGSASGGPYTDVVSLGTNLTSYTNTGLVPTTTYYYVVRATNSYGASIYSAQASATTLAAGIPPGISTQPQSLTVTQGNNASFSVAATGTTPLYYQWRFYATNLPGATGSAYTRSNAQPADAGPYSVVITNAFGNSNSANAMLTVTVIPPAIVQDPVNRAAVPNGYAQFDAAAVGSNVLYQWQENQTNVPGATNASLIISNVLPADFGFYRAVAANSGGSITSAVVQLTLAISPAIILPLLNSNTFELHFTTEFGPIYGVEYKEALDDPIWTELTRTNGTGSPVTITDSSATNATQFYRLHLH